MKYFLILLLLMPLTSTAQDFSQPPLDTVAPETAVEDDAYSPYRQAEPQVSPQFMQEPFQEQLPDQFQDPLQEPSPQIDGVVDPLATEALPEELPEPEIKEPEKIEGKKVILQILDKINASVAELEVDVDKDLSYKELKISVKRCVHSPKDSKEENIAFMRIWDIGRGDYTNIIFSGWMFSSNPALHSFEHPIYDVVLLKCLDDEPAKK